VIISGITLQYGSYKLAFLKIVLKIKIINVPIISAKNTNRRIGRLEPMIQKRIMITNAER
jgi:hypothetical protein